MSGERGQFTEGTRRKKHFWIYGETASILAGAIATNGQEVYDNMMVGQPDSVPFDESSVASLSRRLGGLAEGRMPARVAVRLTAFDIKFLLNLAEEIGDDNEGVHSAAVELFAGLNQVLNTPERRGAGRWIKSLWEKMRRE